MIKFYSIAIFLFSCQFVMAQNVVIQLKVTLRPDNTPLAAKIEVSNADGYYQLVQTDASGTVALQVPHYGLFDFKLQNDSLRNAFPEFPCYIMQTTSNFDIQAVRVPTNLLRKVEVTAPISGISTSFQPLDVSTPANYQDPGRIALLATGSTAQHDGANSIIYQGLAPLFNRWSLNGIEIGNPNHLSNAGTFSDGYSSNTGGINALNTRTLNRLGFGPEGNSNSILALGMAIDQQLRPGNNSRPSFSAQAGLIGLEATAEGPILKDKLSYLVSLRYSTVGLLSVLGVDFGDERIRFGDGLFHLSYRSEKSGLFSAYSLLGSSDNFFAGSTDSLAWVTFKYRYEIHSREDLNISGLRWQWMPTNKWAIETNVNLSNNQGRSTYAPKVLEPTDTAYLQRNSQVTRSQFTAKVAAKYYFLKSNFIELSGQMQQVNRASAFHPFADNLGLRQQQVQLRVANAFDFTNFRYSLGVDYLQGSHNRKGGSAFHLMFEKAAFKKMFLITNLKQNYQFAPWQYTATGQGNLLDAMRNRQVESGFRFITLQGRINLTLMGFYNALDRLPLRLDGSNVFNDIDSYQYISDSKTIGFGRSAGFKFSAFKFSEKWPNIWFHGSILRSEFRNSKTLDWQRSRFDYGSSFYLKLDKQFKNKRDNITGVVLQFMGRGGLREQAINVEASSKNNITLRNVFSPFDQQLSPFLRADIRVFRTYKTRNFKHIWALDLQNVSNRKNEAFKYFDPFLDQVATSYQLSLIPMFSWRWEVL